MGLLNSIKKTIGGEASPAGVATEKKVEATKEAKPVANKIKLGHVHSGIHSNHQELTVGKVDDVHHSKDDGQAEGNQSKKKAHQDSLKKCIEDNH